MSHDWPAWATQKVEIVQPDPRWADAAKDLAADLRVRLRPWLDGELDDGLDGGIEHVGSTSVPGLPAKPIIDLMAAVRSLAACDEAHEPLAAAGWQFVPLELDHRPWRRFFVLPDPGGARRVAHLQLVERSGPRWGDVIAFRDALRRQPALAAAYARRKRDAARAHPNDREAYTEAKSAFVQRVLTDGG